MPELFSGFDMSRRHDDGNLPPIQTDRFRKGKMKRGFSVTDI
jgi:hypothetical protein